MPGCAGATRSSGMAGDAARLTTTGTPLSGSVAASVLPAESPSRFCRDWLAPSAPFSLRCRQLACERIAAGEPVEQSAPHCHDPSRSPDPSTLRRWVQRRLLSVGCWLKAGIIAEWFFRSPTILAWDLAALCRILPIEARSP